MPTVAAGSWPKPGRSVHTSHILRNRTGNEEEGPFGPLPVSSPPSHSLPSPVQLSSLGVPFATSGFCPGPANHLLSPSGRASPKGFVTELSGPPQRQMFTLSCTVGDAQYRVTKFPGPRSPSDNTGGQSRTTATSRCPDKWRGGGAAPTVPGTRCPMQKWPAGQRPGWSRVQAGNENGIVEDTSHLLSPGKKGPLRTQPPAFPQELVASLAGTRSPWAHQLAGRAGKPSGQKQRAGTSWKPLVLWPAPRQRGTSGAPILTLRSPSGHWGRSAPRLQAEQGSTPPPGSRPCRSQAPGTGRGGRARAIPQGNQRAEDRCPKPGHRQGHHS